MSNKFKILIVDDEQNILDVVKAYLEKEDLEVITAMDGEMALNSFNMVMLNGGIRVGCKK